MAKMPVYSKAMCKELGAIMGDCIVNVVEIANKYDLDPCDTVDIALNIMGKMYENFDFNEIAKDLDRIKEDFKRVKIIP